MKYVMIVCEYAAGVLVAIVTLITIAVGGVIGLFEVPRYLKIRNM